MPVSIPEIPEDAPFSPEQREWLKGYITQLVKSLPSAAGSDTSGKANSGESKPRAVFLYGSQSGNAQALSESFSETLNNDGWAAVAVDMEHFSTIDLPSEKLVLVISSTWGEGDPPDNAIEFWEKFNGPNFPRLEKTKFSVLALGDSSYADYCEMGKLFDTRFEELGAERIAPRVDCDVDYEDPADEWFRVNISQLDALGKNQFIPEGGSVPAEAAGTAEPVEEKEVIPWGKKNPFPAPLLVSRKLNLEPSPRDTRHLEYSLAGSGFTYEVGDVVATYPKNDPELVDEMFSVLPFSTKVSIALKDGTKKPLRDALMEDYDICTINKTILKKWAPLCSHPYLIAAMQDDEEMAKIIEGRQVIDLLYDFPADFKSAQDFVGILRKLTPRLYSIASSLKAHPDEVHLTVAKVTYETHGRTRKGVCSTHLCDGMTEGDTVRVFLQNAKHFKLPEDLSRDVIMIGPGTGIAPFRAFLEDRKSSKATGRNWLFFGNAHESTDYFYQDEFELYASENVLTRMDLAWSRDQDHKIYVQDKMRDSSEELWEWVKNGAHVYVCGDATYMAPDVDAALNESIQKHGQMSNEDADAYVVQMKADKRYQRDVY